MLVDRSQKKWWLISLSCILLLSCIPKPHVVNRVNETFWPKDYFNSAWRTQALSPEEWYYALTVVDTPPNTKAASIGDGHWLHPESIRFEITEDYLIGWRSHGSVIGADAELDKSQSNYRGTPVAIFKIEKHLDTNRQYDPVTLEKQNVFIENDTDRPWNARAYIRVNWTKNLATEMARSDEFAGIYGPYEIERENASVAGLANPSDPKRFRFYEKYFDVTTRQSITPDVLSYFGGYGDAFKEDAASPIIDMRHSFLRKNSNSDYEPLSYPDSVVMKDSNGKEIRDSKGFSKKLPIWEKFGFYRVGFSGRQTWDKERGITQSGMLTNITRFNIWKASKHADGSIIPLEQREPKPIEYYTNVQHPQNLLEASFRIGSEWNQVFQEMVFYAQPGKYASANDVPAMFVVKENSCNVDHVKLFISQQTSEIQEKVFKASKVDLGDVAKRIQHANDKGNLASFSTRHREEMVAKDDLEKLCSALEYFTQGSSKEFTYEREGDLRYNMINLVTKSVQTSWSGWGPMLADSISGEIVKSTANINLMHIDKLAAQASDHISVLNGNIAFEDIIRGNDVESYLLQKKSEIKGSTSKLPSEKALAHINRNFSSLQKGGALLQEISSNAVEKNMKLLKNVPFRERTIKELSELGMPPGTQFFDGERIINTEDHFLPGEEFDLIAKMQKKKWNLAKISHTVMDPPEFLDRLVIGLALQYKDLSPRERFEKVREAAYIAVGLHEVGHNVGLAHNMAGSADALNYGERFWQLQFLPEKIEDAIASDVDDKTKEQLAVCVEQFAKVEKISALPVNLTTQDCLRQQEGMYSSIMDYHATWNSDVNGIGLYDKAAIKFGYAQLVEVFPKENLVVNAQSQPLKRWIFLNDWKRIPNDFVKSKEAIATRGHIKYDWSNSSTQFTPPSNEVPYKYCIDASGLYGAECRAWDFGPDMRTSAEWLKTRYWQHYFFTHFSRNKNWTYQWDFQNVISRDLGIFDEFNDIMHWYYYYKAKDPEFSGSDAEKDYLAATVAGLNHFSHVIGHPKSGEYVGVPQFALDGTLKADPSINQLAPTNVLMSWADIDQCTRVNVAEMDRGAPVKGLGNYQLVNIPLGDGRPFFLGLTSDYEDWHISYVGSFYSKLFAGGYLAYPGAWYPGTDQTTDPRFYAVNWYRLFPDAVSKLFYNIVTNNLAELGPLVDKDGSLVHRDLLDIDTLKAPDYSGMLHVMPSFATLLNYRGMLYSAAMMADQAGAQTDMLGSMRVSLKGGRDDIITMDFDDPSEIATFIHEDGTTYRAPKIGRYPISHTLVKNANMLKERYLRLSACVKNDQIRKSDAFCKCVKVKKLKPTGEQVCSVATLQAVGEEDCSILDLVERQQKALEEMQSAVEFLDDMRFVSETYNHIH